MFCSWNRYRFFQYDSEKMFSVSHMSIGIVSLQNWVKHTNSPKHLLLKKPFTMVGFMFIHCKENRKKAKAKKHKLL